MISAKEARDMTESNQNVVNKDQLIVCENSILNAAEKLLNTTTLDITLTPYVKKHLESLGYNVKVGNQYNETYTTISW